MKKTSLLITQERNFLPTQQWRNFCSSLGRPTTKFRLLLLSNAIIFHRNEMIIYFIVSSSLFFAPTAAVCFAPEGETGARKVR